jgi:AcrR family transcriptional regulator
MRKKPRQARAEATVDAIVEAAAQILERDGEEAATTARIAERAGVSIGSVYQYFSNRDAIMAALIRRERETIAAAIARKIAGFEGADVEGIVRNIVATLVAAFRPRRKRRGLVALAAAMRGDSRDDSPARLTNWIGGLLIEASEARRGMTQSPLTPTKTYVLTRAVLGAIRSATLENSRMLDDPAFEEELVRLSLAYLRS